jgi:acyl carrier protein
MSSANSPASNAAGAPQVTERLLALVRRKANSEVNLDATFESLGLDSLAMAELVFEIEGEFGIRADEHLLDRRSLQEVVEYIVNAMTKNGGSMASHQ